MTNHDQATQTRVYSATDALEAIRTFLEAQINEARTYGQRVQFGGNEWNEEQAFLKVLITAQAKRDRTLPMFRDAAHALISFRTECEQQFGIAARDLGFASSAAIDDFVQEAEQYIMQGRCAAWGMVYRFVNAQYQRTNCR